VNDMLQRLMSRIRVDSAPELDPYYPRIWPARVEIRSGDRRFDCVGLHPAGDVESSFGWDGAIAKFHSVVQPTLDRREAEELVARVRTLDEASEMPPLNHFDTAL
jgi:2-methylcitrate dehydratase PrpD